MDDGAGGLPLRQVGIGLEVGEDEGCGKAAEGQRHERYCSKRNNEDTAHRLSSMAAQPKRGKTVYWQGLSCGRPSVAQIAL